MTGDSDIGSTQSVKRIAITPGEPAGIGPDILVQLAQQEQQAELVAIADPNLLIDRAKRLNLPLSIKPFNANAAAQASAAGEITVEAISLKYIPEPGSFSDIQAGTQADANQYQSGQYVLQTLDRAIEQCSSKTLDALVTGPINKHLVNQYLLSLNNKQSFFFSGHTEYLAEQTNTARVVMMLASAKTPSLNKALRVALATTHLPLRDVADAIQAGMLEEILQILNHDLQHHFGISQPRILVCGLNPHAGEQGDLGKEELDVINPCLDKLRKQGINLSDALPADTLFTAKYLDQADAVLAMYHDQGLPVLKSHSFGQAVNITLGLPFIRTSVDHGTAFDLAGTGKASDSSLRAAIDMAIELSQSAKSQHQ